MQPPTSRTRLSRRSQGFLAALAIALAAAVLVREPGVWSASLLVAACVPLLAVMIWDWIAMTRPGANLANGVVNDTVRLVAMAGFVAVLIRLSLFQMP
jgi:cyanate permease